MFKLTIALIVILTICESNAKPRKRSRMGYGYPQPTSYDDSYGGDLLSEYTSDYGISDSYGGGGGGYGGSYGGGYGGGYEELGDVYDGLEDSYDMGGGGYGKSSGGGYGGSKRSGISYGGRGKDYMPKISFKKSIELGGLQGKGNPKQYRVKVPYDDSPVKVLFLTQNTPVHIQQKHKKGQPEYRKATTHEEPSIVVHEVIKPVIQEIREIIVPYRKVIQKIEPVKEERKTIVHKKEGESDGGYGGREDNYDDKKYGGGNNDNNGGGGGNSYKLEVSNGGGSYSSYRENGGGDGDYGRRDNSKGDDDYSRRLGDMLTSSQRVSVLPLSLPIQAANSQSISQLSAPLSNGLTLAAIFDQNPNLREKSS